MSPTLRYTHTCRGVLRCHLFALRSLPSFLVTKVSSIFYLSACLSQPFQEIESQERLVFNISAPFQPCEVIQSRENEEAWGNFPPPSLHPALIIQPSQFSPLFTFLKRVFFSISDSSKTIIEYFCSFFNLMIYMEAVKVGNSCIFTLLSQSNLLYILPTQPFHFFSFLLFLQQNYFQFFLNHPRPKDIDFYNLSTLLTLVKYSFKPRYTVHFHPSLPLHSTPIYLKLLNFYLLKINFQPL